ncbi:DUF4197 domain-containing protein [soil metagenome]
MKELSPIRRRLMAAAAGLASTAALPSFAADLSSLTNADASSGLRTALGQGIDVAVSQLGAPGGFLNDPKVTIPLPPALAKADKALRMMGKGEQADELKTAMNRAAESAVSEAKPVFKAALSNMSVADAKGILTGGDDAGTQYFKRTTSTDLTARFKPIVANETKKVQLASLYNQYAGQAASLGLVKAKDADVDSYVTGKALDGLFSRIAEQEKAIRQDPVGQSSAILKKVFGALK